MDIFEAIHTRQSTPNVKQAVVPEEFISKILAAAVQAPNHHKVRPWRFFVLTGKARERLGEEMARSLKKRQPAIPAAALEVERKRALRAPLVIAVGVDHPADEKDIEIENVCATAAAVQNLLLTSHALGLGAMWRTGPAAYDADIKSFFGLLPTQHLIGFIYIGFPTVEQKRPERQGYEDRTVWITN